MKDLVSKETAKLHWRGSETQKCVIKLFDKW